MSLLWWCPCYFQREGIDTGERKFRQRFALIQAIQIAEDGLFDQPVRCTVNLAGGCLDALAGGVIKLNAHGCRCHRIYSFWLSLGGGSSLE
ncbi:hypothetical protein ABY58_07910 [Edwardsiella ictaluri]|nr:hypothetical protein [Edwardsiella ictaluri]KMQ78587.1 hypothetical protein ABY58_07910 [Edwardsiella ictaluri]